MKFKILSQGTFPRLTLVLFLYILSMTKTEDSQEIVFNSAYSSFNSFNNMEKVPSASFFEPELSANNRMLASTAPSLEQLLGLIPSKAYSIILSQDGKSAFVSTFDTGSLEVIDISHFESPVLCGSMKSNLNVFNEKAIALSPNGNTLFMGNMFTLEVIDVSNPMKPALLGYFEEDSEEDIKNSDEKLRPSLAVNADGNTVYVAGLGFKVFDVSNRTKPTLVSKGVGQPTTVLMSSDRKILFLASNTINLLFKR